MKITNNFPKLITVYTVCPRITVYTGCPRITVNTGCHRITVYAECPRITVYRQSVPELLEQNLATDKFLTIKQAHFTLSRHTYYDHISESVQFKSYVDVN